MSLATDALRQCAAEHRREAGRHISGSVAALMAHAKGDAIEVAIGCVVEAESAEGRTD